MKAVKGSMNKARVVAVVGATGTGKGWYIKTVLLPSLTGQVLVWSPLEESDNYAGILRVKPTHKITEMISQWQGGQSVVFVPPQGFKMRETMFDLFCRAVWNMRNVTVLVEELSGVTSPSYAPPAWKNLTTAGRHKGMTVIGACQRPAQIDKDFLGNCTEIRCFRVVAENDAKAMANIIRETPEEISALDDGEYIHRMLALKVSTWGKMGETAQQPAKTSKIVQKPNPVKIPPKRR